MAAGLKTGGRKKGTPNKLTHEYRQLLANALAGEIEALPEMIASLEPHQRVDAILKLMKYIVAPIETVSSYDIDKAMLDPDGRREDLRSDLESDKCFSRLKFQ